MPYAWAWPSASDVEVIEAGSDVDLAQEALATKHRAQFGAQQLEGHLSEVLEILGEVDGGHATAADLTIDGVAIGQGCLEAVQKISQDGGSGSRSTLRYG